MINTLNDLLAHVLPRVRNAPANYCLLALRHGWRNWCSESRAFRDVITVTLSTAVKTYQLSPEYDAEVEAVLDGGVRFQTADDVTNARPGYALHPSQYDAMLYANPLGDTTNQVQPALPSTAGRFNGNAQIILRDFPGATVTQMQVDVILVPMLNPDDDTLPVSLANYAGNGIVSGALAWLAGQSGKPWFNAAMYRLEHDKFIDSATLGMVDQTRSGRNVPVLQIPPTMF